MNEIEARFIKEKTIQALFYDANIFYTDKEPRKLLYLFWKLAKVYDAGLLSDSTRGGYLEFEGAIVFFFEDKLQREIEVSMGDDENHEIRLKITDLKKIRPGFFDLWEAEGHVKGASIRTLKETSQETNIEEDVDLFPWEKIDSAPQEDINFIRDWCTAKSLKDLKWNAYDLSRKIKIMRDRYPYADIPKGKMGRRLIKERWEKREKLRRKNNLHEFSKKRK